MEFYGVSSTINRTHIQLSIKLKDLLKITHVDIFKTHEPNNYGYQRKIEKLHLRRLISYIKDEGEKIKFPTPIILGVLERDCIVTDENDFANVSIVKFQLKPESKLNIIDGQHRLKALEEVVLENTKMLETEIMCVISINKTRKYEIQTFIDINSKAKKIKPDLALLALNKLKMIEEHLSNKKTIIEYIAISAAYELNNDNTSMWFNAIKFDFNEEDSISGFVGVSSFVASINSLISIDVSENLRNHSLTFKEVESLIDHFKIILNETWLLVSKKWSQAFYISTEQSETENHYFNPNYEIQKYSGFNAIHKLITPIYSESRNKKDFLNKLQLVLKQSEIEASDWARGGRFSGRTSGTAIQKSVEEILARNKY